MRGAGAAGGGPHVRRGRGRDPQGGDVPRRAVQVSATLAARPMPCSLTYVPSIKVGLATCTACRSVISGSERGAGRSGGDPPGARATVSARGDTLEIDIPRGRLFDADRASSASFAVVWNGAIAAWTVSALAAGSLFGAAFSLPFWVAGALPYMA